MDSPQTTLTQNELSTGQKPVTVSIKPGPTGPVDSPQHRRFVPSTTTPAAAGASISPRFAAPAPTNGPPSANNAAAPIRFQNSTRPPAPAPRSQFDDLQHHRPQSGPLPPPGQSGPVLRLPYGAAQPQQLRPPPPRNVFFGRPPQPLLAGSAGVGGIVPNQFGPRPGQLPLGPPPRGPPPTQLQSATGGFIPGVRPPPPPPPPAYINARPTPQRAQSLEAGINEAPRQLATARVGISADPRIQQRLLLLQERRALQSQGPSRSVDRMAEVQQEARHQSALQRASASSTTPTSLVRGRNESAAASSPLRESSAETGRREIGRNATQERRFGPISSSSGSSGGSSRSDEGRAVIGESTTTTTRTDSLVRGFDDGVRKSLTTPPVVVAGSTISSRNTTIDAVDAAAKSANSKRTKSENSDSTRIGDHKFGEDDQRVCRDGGAALVQAEGRSLKQPILDHRSVKADAENDSGVDESTQRRELPKANGLAGSPTKKTRDFDKLSSSSSPNKSIKSLPKTPDSAPTANLQDKKKVPMNKVQVGSAPSPNLKAARSKIGSLDNTTHRPGGGNIKIENKKLDFSNAQSRIAAKNDNYQPTGGDKKITQVKLQWSAKSKIGSLDNASYKPGGGDKKIESVKLDFKDKAKPKVGSKDNAKHVPGGGAVKSSSATKKTSKDSASNIENHKFDIKAESKIGSLDNVKYKPKGGDKKIFDDKTYLRQTSSNGGSGSQSPTPSSRSTDKNGLIADENLNQER